MKNFLKILLFPWYLLLIVVILLLTSCDSEAIYERIITYDELVNSDTYITDDIYIDSIKTAENFNWNGKQLEEAEEAKNEVHIGLVDEYEDFDIQLQKAIAYDTTFLLNASNDYIQLHFVSGNYGEDIAPVDSIVNVTYERTDMFKMNYINIYTITIQSNWFAYNTVETYETQIEVNHEFNKAEGTSYSYHLEY